MRAAFATFGCKLNQFETEALASAFAGRGFSIVPADREADVYLVNTCTVTSRSEQKARRLIRALARRRPGALLVVTGCYAQLAAGDLAGLGPNVRVVPQERKDSLLDLPQRLADAGEAGDWPAANPRTEPAAPAAAPPAGDPFRYQVGRYRFHSRAFLKVQDGCDYRCAYCRVPLARGPAVSLAPGEVIRRTLELEAAGYREVVLTGVNLSAYRGGDLNLAGLLRELLSRTAGLRLRLSSLEPEKVDEPLAESVRHPRVCAHFHLPIQSGSPAVLRRMRRRYRPERVREAVRLLRQAKGEPFLAADVLVGFPGESGEEFEQTRSLIEELRLARLHVFPFSPRPGTAAWSLEPRVPERVRDQRAGRLLRLSERLYARYVSQWVGREEEAVLEEPESAPEARAEPGCASPGGGWIGLTGNYLRVRVAGLPPQAASRGRMVQVRIERAGPICAASFRSES